MINDGFVLKKAETEDEKEGIKSLWRETFGDSYEYVEAFYSFFPMCENALVVLDGDKVVGMVNSLDCSAGYDDKIFHGRYIYALAVKVDYRKRGIAKRLLAAGEGGEFTMLVPETPSLFEMYAHLGYSFSTNVDKRFTEPQKLLKTYKIQDGDLGTVRALIKSEVPELANAEFFI